MTTEERLEKLERELREMKVVSSKQVNFAAIMRHAWTGLAIIAIVSGWVVTHRNEMKRDSENDRRQQRVDYMQRAYRKMAGNRSASISDFATAFADIQVLGTKEQRNEVDKIVMQMKDPKPRSRVPLLNMLRNDIRDELNLPAITNEPLYFFGASKNNL